MLSRKPARAFHLVALAVCLFIRWASVDAQPTCTIAIGDGTPPLDVAFNESPAHCGFLQFSWQAFLAMNWPALPISPGDTAQRSRGLPDRTKQIGQDDSDETVWEQFQPNWYLFSPNNPPPAAVSGESFAAWNQHASLPAACGPKNLPPGTKILSALSKFEPMPGVVQAVGGPLIDQNGYYARYEIRLSYETFNYINRNQFYRRAAQTPSTTFDFPRQTATTPGAIFVKAAWKVLSQEERDSQRFHKARAWMFTPGAMGSSVGTTCTGPVVVGLVGLHIVQKTAGFPLQIWATFEHVDNAPDDPANPGTQTKWSFVDLKSTKPANQRPPCPSGSGINCDWQPTSAHLTDITGGPTRAVRMNPIPASPNNEEKALEQINQSARLALQKVNPKSVWQFYKLVDAQWQISFGPPPVSFFPPTKVANLTMETYVQPTTCMTCHSSAKGMNGAPADMSFELGLAWDPVLSPNPIK